MTARTPAKGVVDIEFMVSIMVFLTVIAFVAATIVGSVPKLNQEAFSQDIKSKSFQVSELLLFDKGHPDLWTVLNVGRLGLSNGTRYYIDPAKVLSLRTLCTADYARVKDLLGLDFRNEVILQVEDVLTPTPLDLNCTPAVISEIRPQATMTRVGIDPATNRLKFLRVTVI